MSQKTILIVEDEGVVAKDVQNRLISLGYGISQWVMSGEEALAEIETSEPDLVLMDIHLKGAMDGIETADRIREKHDIPVVFLTAFADDETLDRAKAVGPFGYMLKPFSERDLHSTIQLALYKHQLDRTLKEQQEFLRTLFESVPCSVIVIGENRRVRMMNQHFAKAFRVADPENSDTCIGDVIGCLTPRRDPNQCGTLEECENCKVFGPVLDALIGIRTDRKRCPFQVQDNGKSRQLMFMISAAPIVHQGEQLAILILEDITELTGLRNLMGTEKSFAGIVGASPKMLEVFDTIREVADINVPVMVLGETGTGKELVARAIHDQGSRSRKRFVAVNCGALPDGLLESELFGHVKGAFTGAVRDRKGRFELADGGTIFLDEVGDLSRPMQVKLLRVLQEGTFERVGGEKTVKVDVRVICATNRDLEQEVKTGAFRHDLYYRLCVVPILVPPLRVRIEDVPLLAAFIVEKESVTSGGRQVALSSEVLTALMNYAWPGNVRELQNAIQYSLIKCKTDTIEPIHLPAIVANQIGKTTPQKKTRTGLTEKTVAEALDRASRNKSEAAKILGISRATLYRFLSDNPELGAGG